MKPYSKQRRRYSDYATDPVTGMPIIIATDESGNVYNGGSSTNNTGTSSSSGSGWNWGILTSLANTFGSVATSIWGKGGEWQASAYKSMYDQQKQTNTILWVVIGLVLALGVVLVIRKTK